MVIGREILEIIGQRQAYLLEEGEICYEVKLQS